MKNKLLIIVSIISFPTVCFSQWSVGFASGLIHSSFNYDVQWAYDLRFHDYNGVVCEIPIVYEVDDWLAVRSGLSFQEKGYCLMRTHPSELQKGVINRQDLYLVIPINAVFSFGETRFKGLFNLGCYAGYWLESQYYGRMPSSSSRWELFRDDKIFDENVDNRIELGFCTGVGLCYRYSEQWSFSVENQIYIALSDQHKNYQRLRFPSKYILALFQFGVMYYF